MSLRPIAKGSRDDTSMVYCAHCGKYVGLGIRVTTTINGEKYYVCSFECSDALKAAKAKEQED